MADKRLRIGQLRQRVQWNKLTGETKNSVGQPVPAYTSQGTFWASVEPLNVSEIILADSQEAIGSHTVTMRWVGKISEKDQLIYTRNLPDGTSSSVKLEVASVLDQDELHFFVVLLCKEVKT